MHTKKCAPAYFGPLHILAANLSMFWWDIFTSTSLTQCNARRITKNPWSEGAGGSRYISTGFYFWKLVSFIETILLVQNTFHQPVWQHCLSNPGEPLHHHRLTLQRYHIIRNKKVSVVITVVTIQFVPCLKLYSSLMTKCFFKFQYGLIEPKPSECVFVFWS